MGNKAVFDMNIVKRVVVERRRCVLKPVCSFCDEVILDEKYLRVPDTNRIMCRECIEEFMEWGDD